MKKYDILNSLVAFIIGLVLLISPGGIITTIIRIFGVLIMVLGVSNVIGANKNNKNKPDLIYGLLIVILGIVFISNPEVIAGIVPFIFGVWIVIRSLFRLQLVMNIKNTNNYVKSLVITIATLVLGIILMFNPFKGAEAVIRIIGVFMITYALLDILDFYFTNPKRIKVIK